VVSALAPTALSRKRLRELGQLRGQVATIALVVASGLVTFVSMRGTYESIEHACAGYYEHSRFADLFARAKRVPESVARQIEALPGVARLETRVVEEITLPIEGMARPAYGQILSLPDGREPATNVPYLRHGRWPEGGREDEVVVLESFAQAHGLRAGDTLPAVLNGKCTPTLASWFPTRPRRPNASSNATPPTTGGRTIGNVVSARTSRFPG